MSDELKAMLRQAPMNGFAIRTLAYIEKLEAQLAARCSAGSGEEWNPTDEQVRSAAMWYRHDLGLLTVAEATKVKTEARLWLRSWQKEVAALRAEPQASAVSVDQQLEQAGKAAIAIRNELDRTRVERDSWEAQFHSAAAAASEYSEFWEKHRSDFDQFGNYIPYSQMDGDLRAAKAEIERLRALPQTVSKLEAEIGMLREKLSDALASGLPHKSDCAVYSAPAHEPGPCDCGVGASFDDGAFDLALKLRQHNGWVRVVSDTDAVNLIKSFIASRCQADSSPQSAPSDDLEDLVARFSKALLAKLKLARANGRSGWEFDDWEEHCQAGLLRHLAKGDPRDVAAYCAFMWHHGWATKAADRQSQAEIAK